jgi:uncharacterized repeat protein (TIGR03803 family)
MQRWRTGLFVLAVCASAVLASCAPAQPVLIALSAMQERARPLTSSNGYAILHSFSSAGGVDPGSRLLYFNGAFYGTAKRQGGSPGVRSAGTVFKIDLEGHERVLHRFKDSVDGFRPMAGLTEYRGRLYGTTYFGAIAGCQGLGCGTIFSVLPSGSHFTTLYKFRGKRDGGEPNSDLTLVNGILYGTTQAWDDGSCVSVSGCGTVYAFDIATGHFKTLYDFKNRPDGNWPSGRLVSVNGTLYGTAMFGGEGLSNNIGYGGVFSVTPTGQERMVYRCHGDGDCSVPSGGLKIFHGTLYGTSTYAEGYYGSGVVFSVTPRGKERTVYSFTASADAMNPQAPLTLQNGVLYGTTIDGGRYELGTAFRVTPAGELQILHDFGGPDDGRKPAAAMTFVNDKLYGTLADGGDNNKGLLFSLDP